MPLKKFLEFLNGFGRDLVHAARALANARAFTVVCVREDLGLPLSNVEHLAYVAAAAFAVLVAVVASLAPARRAASVAPMVAMRSE